MLQQVLGRRWDMAKVEHAMVRLNTVLCCPAEPWIQHHVRVTDPPEQPPADVEVPDHTRQVAMEVEVPEVPTPRVESKQARRKPIITLKVQSFSIHHLGH